MQTFHLLNSVIDRLADGAAPFAPGLLALLPGVWAQAVAAAPLLGMQVLGTLARLVFALGPGSPGAYSLLVPALRAALVPAGDPGLLEDGLQTWLVALRCAPGRCALGTGPALCLYVLVSGRDCLCVHMGGVGSMLWIDGRPVGVRTLAWTGPL